MPRTLTVNEYSTVLPAGVETAAKRPRLDSVLMVVEPAAVPPSSTVTA
jgi:hypothetical protein